MILNVLLLKCNNKLSWLDLTFCGLRTVSLQDVLLFKRSYYLHEYHSYCVILTETVSEWN